MDISTLRATGARVSDASLDLNAARRDLWPRATLEMREGVMPPAPTAVAWPETADQVSALLAEAEKAGRPVVPFGAGSGVCGAAAGRDGALVLDMKRMGKVLSLDRDARTVRVQPGLLGQHLEDWLARRGWMTAHSPSSIMCSTVGGYLAARGAGQFSSRYGVFDDMLLAGEARCPRGVIRGGWWTPPGDEDLLPILAGSEGALGVVTEALIRVVPLPDTRWLRGLAFPDLDAAWAFMRDVMQAELWPSVLRLYDPIDTRIGGPARGAAKEAAGRNGKGWFDKVRRLVEAAPALRRHLLEVPLALPRLVNRISAGLGDEVLVILGFEGPQAVVDAVVAAAEPLWAGARDLGAAPGEYWFRHRHDVSYKLAPVFAAGGWADTMEVASTWSALPALHEKVRAGIGQHAAVMAHFSHAYPEGCSIYFSFAGAGLAHYKGAWTKGLAAAGEAGGTVTHHHGVGQLKAAAAAREAGAAVRVWDEIRAQLDPAGVMNPGRLFTEPPPGGSGPDAPTGGPVFDVDGDSRLAEVDPHAPIEAVTSALAARGYRLRHTVDRPLGPWLLAMRRGDVDPWVPPLFALQARFSDGVAVRVGGPPRSAAGPDLRWGLLRRARAEMVQVPVRPAGPITHVADAGASAREAVRPIRVGERGWELEGPAAEALARVVRDSSWESDQ